MSNRVAGVLASLLFISASSAAAPTALADTPLPPLSPSGLSMAAMGSPLTLPAGSWISAPRVNLRFQVQVALGPDTPQVEIEPSDAVFSNQPNFSGPQVTSSGTASVVVNGLKNGRTYRWQARVVDSAGNASPWVRFSPAGATTPDIGVDQDPPSRPVISSATNPDDRRWYSNRVVRLSWGSSDALSGVRGYRVVLEKDHPRVIPQGPVSLANRAALSSLADGVWFVAVRAQDRAGNWSPTATYGIRLDRRPPVVSWLSPGRFTFNPYQGPTHVQFRVNKDAGVQAALYRVGSRSPTTTYWFPSLRAGQVTSITWSGKDARGRPVPAGFYFFSIRASDHAGNQARWNLGGISVNPQPGTVTVTGQRIYPGGGKLIIVSLARQTLYAYDGDKLVLQTLVTTGNPNLPTPPGSYHILARYHPYEFVSPWPPGSPYWYPPSWSTYAMLFREGGYFLHDAPWRGVFGPGSNGPGQPGSNYGGTHGCVNIPPAPTLFLWNWAPTGTPVLVV